jgi:hypothetical protein
MEGGDKMADYQNNKWWEEGLERRQRKQREKEEVKTRWPTTENSKQRTERR